MRRLVPPAVLAQATDELLTRHKKYGYERLINWLTKKGYRVVSAQEVYAEQKKRGLDTLAVRGN